MQLKLSSDPIKVIGFKAPSGSSIYRQQQIFKYLNRTGKYQCLVSPMSVTDEQMVWADIIFLHATVDPRQIADAWAYKCERGKKIITDLDDTMEYKEDSPFYKRNKENNAKPWTQELLKISDLVTVTTKPLYDEAIKFNENVHILPNYLDMELWDIGTVPNETGKIRIGWSGSITHRPDLEMVAPVIKKILKSHDNVKFISCGDDYVDKLFNDLDPRKHEYVQSMPDYLRWPQMAHTLMYDIGIAPLVESHFNRCKSNLKYLEYGMTKAAGIYSPAAYEETIKDWETGFVAHDLDEWEKYLTMLVEKPTLRHHIRKTAYEDVKQNYSLEKHIGKWDKLYYDLLWA